MSELLDRKQNGENMMDRVAVLQHTEMAVRVVLGIPFKYAIEEWSKDSDVSYVFKGKTKLPPPVEYRNKHRKKYQTFLINKDMTLWDEAEWTGCAVYADPFVPLAFGLAFANKEKGRAIFEEWKKKTHDSEPPVRIIIAKGIDAQHPCWYRVGIIPDILTSNPHQTMLFAMCTRCHTMTPETNKNLSFLELGLAKIGRCRLVPMFSNSDGTVELPVDFSLSFDFSKIAIVDAYQIRAHSEMAFVLASDDNPVIPESRKTDAPVLKALEELRNRERKRQASSGGKG